MCLDRRVPFCSLPQILHDEFLRGREVLVVAGTHGKTTTTSMLAWIFDQAGVKPSFLIGGIAENFGSSFQLGEGKHFILEGDEYDTAFFDKGPKFLHYFPDAVILTSVEFDHADIYKDLDAVETAFKRLVNLIPGRGRIVALDTGESVERCLARAFCPVERFGNSRQAMWQVTNLRLDPTVSTWTVLRNGEHWADFGFALGRRIQRNERDRGGRPGVGMRNCERADRFCLEDVQKREAAVGSASASQRHYHHRRLRAPSHRDCGHAESVAIALSRCAPVGDS